jgi:hypothetical protein
MLPFIDHAGNNVGKNEKQCRQMPFVDWKEVAPFKKDGFPVGTERFWIGVLQHKVFKELATFALITKQPVRNAIVERIFSLVSFVKMKPRKRMQLNLLDAIVRVRAELLLSNKCCKDFTASPAMLQNFTSDKGYAIRSTHSNGEHSNDMDLNLFM